jgi:hypothetical protein
MALTSGSTPALTPKKPVSGSRRRTRIMTDRETVERCLAA